MIVTINIEPEDLEKLDELAGPRGRSRWMREVIAERHAKLLRARAADADMRRAITNSRRKATTPRKKAA